MNTTELTRILVVDDEQAITDEFQKVLASNSGQLSTFEQLDSKLFGNTHCAQQQGQYELTICHQGDAALEAVRLAQKNNTPFAVAFMDVRMPPGPDGIWAAQQIRSIDPDINIVIVTAFSDIDPQDISKRVQPADKLLYVQKPFYPQEIRQFAAALSAKWKAQRDLVERNAQLQQAYLQLDKAYNALSEADALKTNFIVTISHELRTPLTVFKNVVENAVAGAFGKLNDKFTKNLELADENVNRLSSLVTGFVELTEMEMGRTRFSPGLTHITQIVAGCKNLVEQNACAKNLHINLNHNGDDVALWADQKWITRAICNVLDNAIKFSPENGAININITVSDHSIETQITDSGCGIEEKDLDRIFDRFVRVHTTYGPGNQGIGIGLTMAKLIVERHRGAIRAESVPGKGTTITITLPHSKSRTGEHENVDMHQAAGAVQ
jgi:signal transduction histidine kinase